MLLYDDCELTREENKLLIMAFAVSEHLSDTGLNNLLKLIDHHLPEAQYNSKYSFLKDVDSKDYISYSYCSNCYNVFKVNTKEIKIKCSLCKIYILIKDLKENYKIFYYMPLKEQLIKLVNSPEYLNFRKEGNDSDLINGQAYKKLREKGVIADNDITVQFNVDGVSLHKTSGACIYISNTSIRD